MSSQVDAELALRGHGTSELPRYLAWSPVLVGALIALIGVMLAGGGAYLAALGGSWYYVLVGVMLVAAGYLMIRRRIAGIYTYIGAFAFTAVWAFWEVGLSGWALIPRLVGPFVLLVLAVLVAPALDPTGGRRARNWGMAGVGIFVVALAILIPIFNQLPAAAQLPNARADAFFEDPSYAPKKGEWSAYGGGQSAQRYSEVAQITPENVKNLKRVWTFNTGDIPNKYGSELTPLKIDDAIYGCTPMNKLFALNAATGEKLWMYDPQVPAAWVPYTAACRGVAFYRNPNATAGQACAERIIEGTLDMRLIAVDAKSGSRARTSARTAPPTSRPGWRRRIARRAPSRPSFQGRPPSPRHRSSCRESSSPGMRCSMVNAAGRHRASFEGTTR
jgi:quinoprotein glucose dehydrogenase